MVGQLTIDNRVELVRSLTSRLALNEFGLPDGIYRPDLLLLDAEKESDDIRSSASTRSIETPAPTSDDHSSSMVDEDSTALTLPPEAKSSNGVSDSPIAIRELQVAWMSLCYDEGFPTLENGLPFWSRLEFEPHSSYETFQRYLLQGGAGARQLYLIADEFSLDTTTLQDYYHLYYWDFRCRAYDIFTTAERRRISALRRMSVEDEHYTSATKVHELAMEYIEGDEFKELMTPKTALEALRLSTQLHRVSAGLPAAGPPNGSQGAKGGGALSEHVTDIRVALRQVANMPEGKAPTLEINSDDDIARILDDPEATEIAQELLVRVTQNRKPINPMAEDDDIPAAIGPDGLVGFGNG